MVSGIYLCLATLPTSAWHRALTFAQIALEVAPLQPRPPLNQFGFMH